MLVQPTSIVKTEDTLHLQIPQATGMIQKWLSQHTEPEVSIRWAVGREASGTLVVIGVRFEGRGFDIGLKKSDWDVLLEDPDKLVIHYGEPATDAADASNRQDSASELAIEIPTGSFDDFIEICQAQVADDPGKATMADVVHFFVG